MIQNKQEISKKHHIYILYGATIYATHHIRFFRTISKIKGNTPYMFLTNTPYIQPERGATDTCAQSSGERRSQKNIQKEILIKSTVLNP